MLIERVIDERIKQEIKKWSPTIIAETDRAAKDIRIGNKYSEVVSGWNKEKFACHLTARL